MLTDIKLRHDTENALYCIVNAVSTVFLSNIHSDKRVVGPPPKEVLYFDGIAK